MIRIVHERGVSRVACFCDACDREITDAKRALYSWDYGDASTATPKFFHKGKCDRRQPMWDELERFSLYLDANLDVDRDFVEESARVMAGL